MEALAVKFGLSPKSDSISRFYESQFNSNTAWADKACKSNCVEFMRNKKFVRKVDLGQVLKSIRSVCYVPISCLTYKGTPSCT